jgi:hypothetical protein
MKRGECCDEAFKRRIARRCRGRAGGGEQR